MATVSAVIPMKPLTEAKTRLALPPLSREALALAMFKDTLRAVIESTHVAGTYVVTRDPEIITAAQGAGGDGRPRRPLEQPQ